MGSGSSRRSAIVADRRPLERGLARFLLEERGLFVVGEAATMADVLLQVQELRPDLVVLHEKLALDHDPTVVAQIRRISPRTSIVLLAADQEALPPKLLLLADAVVVDGPGLTELGVAVAGSKPAADVTVPEVQAAGKEATRGAVATSPSRRRWADRLQGMAVVSIVALAILFARDGVLGPSPAASAHLQAAERSLQVLAAALPNATPGEIAKITGELIDERARALQAGADVGAFDQDVWDVVLANWLDLPADVRALLLAVLEIVGGDEVLPSPSPAPPPPDGGPPPDAGPPPDTGPPPDAGPPPVTEPPPTTTTEPPTTTTTEPPTTTTTTEPPTTTTTTEPPTTTTTEPPTTTTEPPTTTTEPPTTTTTTEPPTTTTTTEPPTTTTEPPTTTAEPPTTTTEPPTTTTESPTTITEPPTTTTTTEPPTEGQVGSLVALPSMLAMAVALSGWARRRARRIDEREETDV